MDDDYTIEDEMTDDYCLGTFPEYYEEEIVADPRTGLTPRQLAYLEYRQACEEYEVRWVGVPWYARREYL